MSFIAGYLLGFIALGAYCYDLRRRLKILQLENAELTRRAGVLEGYQGGSSATANELKGYRVTYNHFTGKTEIVTVE